MKKILYLFLILFIHNLTYSQDSLLNKYLMDNRRILDIESDTLAIECMDDTRLFFLGETHHQRLNPELMFYYFKYLYEYKGVRVLCFESSPWFKYYLNKYIKSGDINHLEKIKIFLHISEGEMRLFEKLHEFYKSLPENDKFFVESFDVVLHRWTNIHLLNEIIDNKNLSSFKYRSDLNPLLKLDNGKKHITQRKFYKIFSELYLNYKEKELEYNHFLGNDSVIFKEILKTVVETSNLMIKSAKNFKLEREIILYDVFQELVEKYPNVNIFTQIGRDHVYVEPYILSIFTPVCYKLNTDYNSPLKGRVCSIIILYLENGQINNIGFTKIFNPAIISVIEKLSISEVTVFNICEKDSPLHEYCKFFDSIIVVNENAE